MSSTHPAPSIGRAALAVVVFSVLANLASAQAEKITYPASKTIEQVDDFHGEKVADPYRWLEDDVRESKDVRSWVTAQNEVTFSYLSAIPERDILKKRIAELWNYEKFSSPFKAGGRYYYYRNDGLQNQSVLYTMDTLKAEARIFIDPNSWSKDGTVALSGTSFSPDGRWAAYGIQDAGSDWRTWRIKDIDSGKTLDEEIRWVKFSSFSWTPDGEGFFYSRYPAPKDGAAFQSLNLDQEVYYHRVGTPQARDILVHRRPDQPTWGFSPRVTDDGRYLVLTVWKGTGNVYRVVTKDLREPFGMPVPLIDTFDHEYSFVGNDGTTFYFKTDLDAPRGRLVALDVRKPGASPREIIPQAKEALTNVSFVGNLFVASYLKDATTSVKIHRPSGKLVRDVEFPGLGSANGFGGRRGDLETFYSYSSFVAPPTTYRYDMITGESTLFRQAKVPFDPAEYMTRQVFYESKDGTKVPMFVSHRKDLELTGDLPTLLYGYGGFNISLTPRFSVSRIAWMEMGGVYAQANLRGGGEYGEEWHEAGTKLKKQNVFDDFIAAAEWLIANDYTNKSKLAIQGGSNGGLLVGACMTQRPDLFAACLPAVGVMDMLRFHKFTAGRFWVDDYGCADDPAEFKALRAYSPYHNLKAGTAYPATMVTTADTDDRVVPGHSFKFAAALQQAHAGEKPVLIRIETRAGHGAGKPTTKRIEEAADMWAFLVKNLGMKLAAD